MHCFNQDQSLQNHFTVFKNHFQKSAGSKWNQDRQQIKINKNKLPFDFFKRSVDKKSNRRSPLDYLENCNSIQKKSSVRKGPQTERKINSYQNLPSTEFQPLQTDLASTDVLRFEVEKLTNLHKKIFNKQTTLKKDKTIQKIKKVFDDVNQKGSSERQTCNKIKYKAQKLGNTQSVKKNSNILKKYVNDRFPGQGQKQQILSMGCTFGKGFKMSQSFSLQNTIAIKGLISKNESYIDQQIERETINQFTVYSKQKNHEQKSTQQSEINDFLSHQHSPRKQNTRISEFKLPISLADLPDSSLNYLEQKSNKKIEQNDLYSMNDLLHVKQKSVFTASQKQRKSKYRVNNSSSQKRQKTQKKEKQLTQIFLPRIEKTVKLPSDFALKLKF